MYSYKVYDRASGLLLAQGTTKEAAAQLGMKETGFRAAVDRMRNGVPGKFVIEEFGGKADKPGTIEADVAAAKWDRFVEPLRRKYGVKVHKAAQEVRT